MLTSVSLGVGYGAIHHQGMAQREEHKDTAESRSEMSDVLYTSYLSFQFPWVLDMEPYTTEGMARREEHQDTIESGSETPGVLYTSYMWFQFPWVLDMEPYTTEGMARREEHQDTIESGSETSDVLYTSYMWFQFPWVLDMEPYTTEGMARREEHQDTIESGSETSESGDLANNSDDLGQEIITGAQIEQKQINYELVGIVVHSGQANAGHYYSFIKDRRYITEWWLGGGGGVGIVVHSGQANAGHNYSFIKDRRYRYTIFVSPAKHSGT